MSGISEERVIGRLREAAERGTEGRDFGLLSERALGDAVDLFFEATSPLGEMYVAVSPQGVRFITTAESEAEFTRIYRERFERFVVPAEDGEIREMAQRVARAFAGEKVEVALDFDLTTPFQRRVLEVVRGIPRGEVRPYSWVAREAGSPRASRAVGTVMANNPIPLIIPCHRVIRNDGSPGKYGFDPQKKVKLLKDEGVPVEEVERAPYIATPTTGVVCHATCRNAKRIQPENRLPFRSVPDALDAGFRPCKVCRPVMA